MRKRSKIILVVIFLATISIIFTVSDMTYKIPNPQVGMTVSERIREVNSKPDFFPPKYEDCVTRIGIHNIEPKEYLKISEVIYGKYLNAVSQKILDVLSRPQCYF